MVQIFSRTPTLSLEFDERINAAIGKHVNIGFGKVTYEK